MSELDLTFRDATCSCCGDLFRTSRTAESFVGRVPLCVSCWAADRVEQAGAMHCYEVTNRAAWISRRRRRIEVEEAVSEGAEGK